MLTSIKRLADWLWFLPVLLIFPAHAQDQCGVVTGIGFPVDRSVFELVQDFGVPSPRHQGRYHTGEDYHALRGGTFGQPVSAIAAGRVTFAAPEGWGRDAGVVIIEHIFPDGSVYYSQYGHIRESETVKFPAVFTCVRQGDVIGIIADVRPAPHLHLEIRSTGADIPGPGYGWEVPTLAGWLHPSKFILNWQTWLNPAHRWHVQLPDDTRPASPPLAFEDGSLLVLTSDRVRFISHDGRVLWRIVLTQPAAALTWFQERPLLTYTDGLMQFVNLDGSLDERWPTNAKVEGAPLIAGDLLVFHAPNDSLVAFTSDRQSIAWRVENIPPIVRAYAAPNVLGLITQTNMLLSFSLDGRLLDQAQLTEPAAMTASLQGDLLVYTQDNLWQVDSAGQRTQVIQGLPIGTPGSAALISPSGARYVLGGQPPAVSAYGGDGLLLWQAPVPDVSGQAMLSLHSDVLLLATSDGYLVALHESNGALCNATRIYGDARSSVWQSLSADGVLRVAVADQVIGLDWGVFAGECG
jgi:murein DD-endopeptidase MepM/ murein hydrolase activator NlpD